jgi:hypothetical protein
MSGQLRHGPITRRVIEAVRRHIRMKVVDFAAFRAGQEQAKALQNSLTPKEQLAKTHPAHAAYVSAQNQMSIMAEQLLQMPEMKSFVKQIGPAEDEYAPSWPPMSPVSTSYFTCWSTFDLGIGARRETLGDVIIAVAAECGTHSNMLALMQRLQDSRMGIYRVEEPDGTRVRLQDLATGRACKAVCTSGYSGRTNELWYTRVLPPPLPGSTDHVVFTSPYVLTAPNVTGWTAYLDRVASKTSTDTRVEALEQHFKWGPNPWYWMEFVFEAYSRYESGAIFLHGLPDVAESRPHSPSYRQLPTRDTAPTGKSTNWPVPDTKISEAFLDFAEPLLEAQGAPPTAQEVEKVLQLASTIWNAVVLDTVRGGNEWMTKIRSQTAGHPPLEAMVEQMIVRKQSLFGHDLRLVGEFKILGTEGEWRLRVEARDPMSL